MARGRNLRRRRRENRGPLWAALGHYFAEHTGALYDFRVGRGGMFTDTALTTPAVVDDAIAGVADLTGNGRHLIQSDAGLRPTGQLTGTVFATDLLQSSGNFDLGTAIMAATMPSSPPSYMGIVTNFTDQGTGSDSAFTCNSPPTTWYPVGGAGDMLSTSFFKNGVADNTVVASEKKVYSTVGGSLSFFPQGVQVGRDRTFSARSFNGQMHGLFLINKLLDTTEREAVENFFMSEFEIP